MNFWEGFFLGKLLSGKKETNEEKPGCFYSIAGIIALILSIRNAIVGGLVAGIITFVVACILIGILKELFKTFLYKIFFQNSDIAKEAEELYSNGQYTQAFEKAMPLADKNTLAATIVAFCFYYHSCLK